MINVADRQLPIVDRLEICWWRLVVVATRLLGRARQQVPLGLVLQVIGLLRPVRGYLWLPVATGLAGAFMGLIIVIIL